MTEHVPLDHLTSDQYEALLERLRYAEEQLRARYLADSTGTQPGIAHTHLWDGAPHTLPLWLTPDHYHFDYGFQLVIRTPDGDTRPEPGWTLVHWTDGTVTVASPTLAERVYGTGGIASELVRARDELRQYSDADSADAAAGSYALRAERAEAAVDRVQVLADRWVKAGPPPLGASMARWWDMRLAELHTALTKPEEIPVADETSPEQPPEPSEAQQFTETVHTLQAMVNRVREAVTLDEPAWTPPPPGDRREQLPPAVLALINPPAYVSTACHTAIHLEQAPAPDPTSSGDIPDVAAYVAQLHARCRINHKFTGQLCICRCHTEKEN